MTKKAFSKHWKEIRPEKEKGLIEKFVKFWCGIWETNKKTLNMPWMEEVKGLLHEKVPVINEFHIDKRKSWMAPGIDGLQNLQEKDSSRPKRLAECIKSTNSDNMIPGWWLTGRAILLSKTKDLSYEKNRQLITCLNTLYKILTILIAKHMCTHTVNKG